MMNLDGFNSLFELINTFSSEQKCIEYLESIRWKGTVISPFDSTSKVYKCSNGNYWCKSINKLFNVKHQTIFENSKVPLQKWFMAIWLISSHKKGISSVQLSKDIDVTQKTGWFMLQRIRKCLSDNSFIARIAYIASHPLVSEYPSENLLYALIRNILKSDRKYATFDVLCHFPLRSLIRDVSLLDDAERRYVLNGLSHVDFLIYNRVGKSPLLAIEADGYIYHLDGSRQKERDTMKNRIFELYGIPLERLSTKDSNEEKKIKGWLDAIVS